MLDGKSKLNFTFINKYFYKFMKLFEFLIETIRRKKQKGDQRSYSGKANTDKEA